MCNLYSLNQKRDAVARFFRVSHNRANSFEPSSAIFPRHVAPVVRRSADGEREVVTMSWGFMLLQQGRAPRPVTNAVHRFWKWSARGLDAGCITDGRATGFLGWVAPL
jgi:putative SOS response-associated peptidase YedK